MLFSLRLGYCVFFCDEVSEWWFRFGCRKVHRPWLYIICDLRRLRIIRRIAAEECIQWSKRCLNMHTWTHQTWFLFFAIWRNATERQTDLVWVISKVAGSRQATYLYSHWYWLSQHAAGLFRATNGCKQEKVFLAERMCVRKIWIFWTYVQYMYIIVYRQCVYLNVCCKMHIYV